MLVVSRKALWAGRIVSAITAVLLLLDAVMKVMKAPVAVQATIEVGYPESSVVAIGVALLVSAILYAISLGRPLLAR